MYAHTVQKIILKNINIHNCITRKKSLTFSSSCLPILYTHMYTHIHVCIMTKIEPSPKGASVSRTPEKQMKMRTEILEALDSSWIQDKLESSESG